MEQIRDCEYWCISQHLESSWVTYLDLSVADDGATGGDQTIVCIVCIVCIELVCACVR